MTILRLADQRRFAESDLHVLLAEEGHTNLADYFPALYYSYHYNAFRRNGWCICCGGVELWLTEDRFTVIPDTCIRKEDVKAAIQSVIEDLGPAINTTALVIASESLRSAFSQIMET